VLELGEAERELVVFLSRHEPELAREALTRLLRQIAELLDARAQLRRQLVDELPEREGIARRASQRPSRFWRVADGARPERTVRRYGLGEPRAASGARSAEPGSARREPTGQASASPEEEAFEHREDFLAGERLHLLERAVVLEHAHVVLERAVRRLERVLELVALEEVVVPAWFGARAVQRVDRTADRPEGPLLALDPDHDPLFAPGVVDSAQLALGATRVGRVTSHKRRIQSPRWRSGTCSRSSSSARRRRSASPPM
jgi:hypothetical protein